MDSPFKVTVYDRAFRFKGYIGAPQSASVTPRHNQQGTASLTIASNLTGSSATPRAIEHRKKMVAALQEPGARVVIHHKPWPTKYGPAPDWEFLMSGTVVSRRGKGPSKRATLTVEVQGDAVPDILGWPVPTSPINNQSAAAYATYTGPAETVVKNAARANIQRLGLPITVAPDLGRGAVVPGGVAFRFHKLKEKLLTAADGAGIGITVEQQGAGLVFDVYEQRTYPHELSEKAGTITDWSWSDTDPTATRVIAGGKGEGTARTFAQSIDTGLEAQYPVREAFKDATDVDTTADLTARATAELVDQGPRAGFSVTLSGSGTFQYGGNGVRVGDLVTVDIGGQQRTDVLRECTLAFNVTDGSTQTPVIGSIDDSPDRKLVRWVAKLRTAVNNLTKG